MEFDSSRLRISKKKRIFRKREWLCIYTPQSADGITFAADGKATVTVEQFELDL